MLLCLLLAVQEGRVLLSDRTEVKGEIAGYEAPGYLVVRRGGRDRRIPVEEVARLQFARAPKVALEASAERVRLFHGGRLTGTVRSFREGRIEIETPSGVLALRRADVRSIHLAPPKLPLPELKDEAADVLVRTGKDDEGGEILVAAYGTLTGIGDGIRFRTKEGKELDLPRGEVRRIYLHHAEPPRELPPGWFAKVLFRNGDRAVGVIRSIRPASVRLFSHLFGTADLPRDRIHSVSFVHSARMQLGHLLVCDQTGVREFDPQGREVWAYTREVQHSWVARKLDNGNVLIANTHYNKVLEVRPTGKRGGIIEWQLECQYPHDVRRLENGNTLVVEHYKNRVVEYDTRTREEVWQCHVTSPYSAERLPDGSTLVAGQSGVVTVDAAGQVTWQASLSAVRPVRAHRLENGNTLVVDQRRSRVIELNGDSEEVWTMDGLSRPVEALRLENGNTLILEQGRQRVIEVDPTDPGRPVREMPAGRNPQGLSIY